MTWKSFEYVPLLRLGVPTSDGRILHAAGVWHLASPCPIIRSESLEGHSFVTGTVHGMNFSVSSGMAYASGEAEPEIVAGLLLREQVLCAEFATHGRQVELRTDDEYGNLFMWHEGTIAAVQVRGKEYWPWVAA